jgi:lipopolysaccharide transport system permease protein
LHEHAFPQTLSQPTIERQPLVVIEPLKGRLHFDFRELWDYRELLYFFIWRDLKVRYKQTILGGLWAILQPFLTMVVFSVFFGTLANVPSDNIPYPIFVYTALLPWQLFAFSLATSSQSLVMDQGLISKVYFPRLLVPLAAIFVGLIDFMIAFIVLIGMMMFYRIYPTSAALTLPLFLLLALLTSLTVGVWSSALNVQYRDVRHIIPFLIQFWLFITPVAYPASLVPEPWRLLYGLNPMVGVIEGFRWALLGHQGSLDFSAVLSTIVVISLLVSGLLYFNRAATTFADVV